MNTDKEVYERATFAGGCFWHIEHAFETMPGVTEAVSGYTGGEVKNPSYEQVCSGKTGHYEAVRVIFSPDKADYSVLLNTFWQIIDPTDPAGQFADRGSQYRTAVFYHSNTQRRIAQISKKIMDTSGVYEKPIATEILPAQEFYRAEEYHQDYVSKNPYRTCPHIKTGKQFPAFPLNRDRQKAVEALGPLQYKVVIEKGTERPFDNEYWDNRQSGLYVDLLSGEPLFSSKDKYDSGTGWPGFTRPVNPSSIVLRADYSIATDRIEVRSSKGDAHLGHVFTDGPEPAGLRFCMNSAALRFIPWDRLEDEGYGQWKKVLQPKY